MDEESDVIREAARSAGLGPGQAKDVLDLAETVRAKEAAEKAKRPPGAPRPRRRTGFFAALRRRDR
ncbi:MAG TPA: hypothetical protein VG388_09685 [Solirubrobacteraceae bacterium]|nr:hypothetical protein [Solirubrobacteraceae bacterium]